MIVLDASVIAKWFLEEEKSDEALFYQKLHLKGEEKIIVPGIATYELANLFRFKQGFTEKDAILALNSLEDFDIEIVPFNFKDLVRVAVFTGQSDTTVYDSAYVVLALDFGCELITADERLFNRVKDLGCVKLL